jgi:hypothetical protein
MLSLQWMASAYGSLMTGLTRQCVAFNAQELHWGALQIMFYVYAALWREWVR